jgi:predicted nuclease of predicted toxin-antitoxin system
VKFKIDENLSPSLATMFEAAGHDALSVVQQALGGQPDERIIDVCGREQRALITSDLDFSNILTYPPAKRGPSWLFARSLSSAIGLGNLLNA